MEIIQGERTILVATDDGLHIFEIGHGAGAGEASRIDDLAGREVIALESSGEGPWALVDGRELWRRTSEGWSSVASSGRRKATCLAATPAGLPSGTPLPYMLLFEYSLPAPIPS